jgi:hypothetical protein
MAQFMHLLGSRFASFASEADLEDLAVAPNEVRDAEAPAVSAANMTIEGEVFEVLSGYGLAHVRTTRGTVVGLNRKTPGIAFDQLREGQRVRCEVASKFNRVLRAQLIA